MKTLKQRKWFSITTKNNKRITSLRTSPDEIINHPLQTFHIDYIEGKVRHIGSQPVCPISKYSANLLVSKEVVQAIGNISLENIVMYVMKERAITDFIRQIEDSMAELSIARNYPVFNYPVTIDEDYSTVEVYISKGELENYGDKK